MTKWEKKLFDAATNLNEWIRVNCSSGQPCGFWIRNGWNTCCDGPCSDAHDLASQALDGMPVND